MLLSPADNALPFVCATADTEVRRLDRAAVCVAISTDVRLQRQIRLVPCRGTAHNNNARLHPPQYAPALPAMAPCTSSRAATPSSTAYPQLAVAAVDEVCTPVVAAGTWGTRPLCPTTSTSDLAPTCASLLDPTPQVCVQGGVGRRNTSAAVASPLLQCQTASSSSFDVHAIHRRLSLRIVHKQARRRT